MKRKGMTTAALLGTLSLPLFVHASDYSDISRQAETSARWGLLGTAAESYRRVLADPQMQDAHTKARLKLAKLYMDGFDYPAARGELEQLIASAPESPEAEQAKKLLTKLSGKTRTHKFEGKLQVALIHDTDTANASAGNPSSEPSFDDEDGDDDFEDDEGFEDDDLLDDLLDEDLELDEDELDEEDEDDAGAAVDAPKRSAHDNRRQAAAALRYSYGLNQRGDRWNLAANLAEARQDEQTQLNRQTWAVSTGPVFLIPDLRLKINPAVTYLQLYKTHKYELSSTVWSLGVSHKVNRMLELGVRYNYENRGPHAEDDAPDVEIDALKLSARFKPTSTDSFDLSYAPKVENNDKRVKDKDQHGWKIGYARKLPWDSFASVAYARRHSEYDNDPKGKEEDEDKYSVSLGHKLTRDITVAVSYERKDKDSNLPGKDKDNESTALSVSYRF